MGKIHSAGDGGVLQLLILQKWLMGNPHLVEVVMRVGASFATHPLPRWVGRRGPPTLTTTSVGQEEEVFSRVGGHPQSILARERVAHGGTPPAMVVAGVGVPFILTTTYVG